ncbi:hypothetical protein M9H77_14302 [Catharanthus roseus]|uniref:Uncharacterized protein n=1 Tax=Catharanthus roseus TaxID=4058 RepID=A0ACC0BMV0_CATRO|nr:hypothetical protein M9H77_14302 [Catharanthus roseus]
MEYPYPGRVIRQFTRAQHIPDACDTRLDLHRIQLRGNDHTYWGTQHASHVDVLSYPNDEYIRWYRGITRVYIGNPANRDTRSVGYQPIGLNRRMMELDDMASVVIQEPPSSPSQMVVFCEESENYYFEVHGIYWQYVGLHSITARYSTDISSITVMSPSLGARTGPGCSWS